MDSSRAAARAARALDPPLATATSTAYFMVAILLSPSLCRSGKLEVCLRLRIDMSAATSRCKIYVLIHQESTLRATSISSGGSIHCRRRVLSETGRRRENASNSEETNDEHESLVLPRAQRFLGLYCYLLNYKAERCKPRRTRLRRVRTSIPMRRNSRPWLACSSSCRAILVHDFLRTR